MEAAIGWILCLAAGAHTAFTKLHDAAHPFDDKEWQIEIVEIPREKNSVHDFFALEEVEHDWSSQREALTLLSDATSVTGYSLDKKLTRKLKAIRKEHETLFAPVDRIVNGKQLCTAPYSTSQPETSPMSSLLKYGNHLHLHMLDSIQNGRTDSFLRDWKKVQKLATELYSNNSYLVNLLVGMSLQARAIPALSLQADELARHGDLESLKALQDSLGAAEPSPGTLRKALKGEYNFLNTLIAESNLKDLGGLLETSGSPRGVSGAFDSMSIEEMPQFLPNRFRREMCAHYEHVLRAGPVNPSGDAPEIQMFTNLKRPGTMARSAIEGNMIGTVLFSIGMPTISGVRRNQDLLRAKFRILQLKAALLRYEVKNGQLPKNASSLSPQYIKSIPVDPFSGKPLRFNPNKRTVYSVGLDGEDKGGAFQDFLSKKDGDFGLVIPEISR